MDAYEPCPCGSGKKVKFCCAKDIAAELGKVMRSLEGEQRLAAVDQINQLLASKGDLPCLLAVKGNTLLQLGELEKVRETIERLFAVAAQNPVAFAQAAILDSAEENELAAVAKLQSALTQVGESMPLIVYEAIGAVAHSLIMGGNILAGRAHLVLQAALGGQEDTRAFSMLMRLNSATETPILIKQEFLMSPRPDDVAWGAKFDAAMALANRGAWAAAVEALSPLAEKFPQEPALWRNMAILHGWLAENDAAAAAWRKYAALDAVSLDDAVEAEALAQLQDAESYQDRVEELIVTYPVSNLEALLERLVSSKRVSQMPVDTSQLGSDAEPPPKAVYWVLDKDIPDTGVGLTLDAAPNVIGECFVFGKQTDRDARVEFSVRRDAKFEEKTELFKSALGETLGEPTGEAVEGDANAVSAALSWSWRLPDDTPAELRLSLMHEKRRQMMFQVWPELPLSILDGKTARAAAGEAGYERRILAAILLLELEGEQNQWDLDFNELRRDLGLPTLSPIDPWSSEPARLPLARLARLDLLKLSDDDLINVYRRAAMQAAVKAARTFAQEVVSRDSLKGKVDRAEAYGILSRYSSNPDDSLEYILKAAAEARNSGESPAQYLLSELALRIRRREIPEIERLVQQIQQQHVNEPGVAQALYEMLVRSGLINPQSVAGQGMPRGAAPAGTPTAPAAPDPGGVWTPGGQAPAAPAAGEEGKSKLWVPGMD